MKTNKYVKYKEQCRLFYMVKGHLNTDPSTIKKQYNYYFKKLWYNEEAYYREHDFHKHYIEHIHQHLTAVHNEEVFN